MSMWLAAQAWNCKLDKTRLVILMALCDSAEDDGSNCFPSPRYIAWKTGSSPATVYRVLSEFEDKKYIEAVGTKGDTVEYVIHIETVPVKSAFQRLKQGRPRRKKSSHGEKRFSPREKNRTVRKVASSREKFSQGDNDFSHDEKEKHRSDTAPAAENSEVVSNRDGAYPSISTQVYDPGIENSGATPSLSSWLARPENRELARTAPYHERRAAYEAWCAAQETEPRR